MGSVKHRRHGDGRVPALVAEFHDSSGRLSMSAERSSPVARSQILCEWPLTPQKIERREPEYFLCHSGDRSPKRFDSPFGRCDHENTEGLLPELVLNSHRTWRVARTAAVVRNNCVSRLVSCRSPGNFEQSRSSCG